MGVGWGPWNGAKAIGRECVRNTSWRAALFFFWVRAGAIQRPMRAKDEERSGKKRIPRLKRWKKIDKGVCKEGGFFVVRY